MNATKVILGAAAGLAIGAALGVLFAPDKGENIRKKIADQGSGLKDKYNDVIDSITSKLDGMERKVENQYQQGRENFDNMNTTV